jgi:hypothetical protein
MKFTREKGVLRILVGCLDCRRIPAKERIFIGDGFYDISFEVQVMNDLEMTSVSIPGEDQSDGDDHGNNGDNIPESQKNQDAMDTDAASNQQGQEGSKNSSANGPDINRPAGEFSSGVRFSPRVKRMMEQSRIELSAFISSLSSSAAVAESPPLVAARPDPAPVSTPVSAASGSGDDSPAAAMPVAKAMAAPASSPAAAAMPEPAAVSAQAGAAPSFETSAAAAEVPAAAVFSAGAEKLPIVLPGSPSCPSAAPSMPAAPTRSFRSSAENAGEVLRGSETPPSPILAAAGTDQLHPREGNIGLGSLEEPEATTTGNEKTATMGKTSTRIAATTSSPSTPTTKLRKKEDVIAFGGISEKMASPTRSSLRVRMQPNGDATQMERATQLAEKRLHVLSPGTKSKLSFSNLSEHEISARANTLGVSLGSNESEISNSIDLLKRTEEDRRITYLQNNLNDNLGEENDSEILDTTNQLCLDLELEDRIAPMGDAIDSALSMPIKMLKRRGKKNSSSLGVSVRRSTRINNFKKNLQ